jgi:hypothetical protein
VGGRRLAEEGRLSDDSDAQRAFDRGDFAAVQKKAADGDPLARELATRLKPDPLVVGLSLFCVALFVLVVVTTLR